MKIGKLSPGDKFWINIAASNGGVQGGPAVVQLHYVKGRLKNQKGHYQCWLIRIEVFVGDFLLMSHPIGGNHEIFHPDMKVQT